jgi:CBS domain-containing membrane protein
MLKVFFQVTVGSTSRTEHLKAAGGALAALLVAQAVLWLFPEWGVRLIPPIGATITILFIQPHSPVASPTSVFGGYAVSLVSAWIASLIFATPWLAIPLAVSLTIWGMMHFRCVHPPAGAAAIVLLDPGIALNWPVWLGKLTVLGVDSILIVLATIVVSVYLIKRPYPFHPAVPAPAPAPQPVVPAPLTHITLEDLDGAIRSIDTFVDIQEEEMLDIYERSLQNAMLRAQTPK